MPQRLRGGRGNTVVRYLVSECTLDAVAALGVLAPSEECPFSRRAVLIEGNPVADERLARGVGVGLLEPRCCRGRRRLLRLRVKVQRGGPEALRGP